MSQDFKCEFCGEEFDTLYEGWFRTVAATQPHAVGTASAGVIQNRRACKECLQKLIDTGMACTKSIPGEDANVPNSKETPQMNELFELLRKDTDGASS